MVALELSVKDNPGFEDIGLRNAIDGGNSANT